MGELLVISVSFYWAEKDWIPTFVGMVYGGERGNEKTLSISPVSEYGADSLRKGDVLEIVKGEITEGF
jgi:hypothetical protein